MLWASLSSANRQPAVQGQRGQLVVDVLPVPVAVESQSRRRAPRRRGTPFPNRRRRRAGCCTSALVDDRGSRRPCSRTAASIRRSGRRPSAAVSAARRSRTRRRAARPPAGPVPRRPGCWLRRLCRLDSRPARRALSSVNFADAAGARPPCSCRGRSAGRTSDRSRRSGAIRARSPPPPDPSIDSTPSLHVECICRSPP